MISLVTAGQLNSDGTFFSSPSAIHVRFQRHWFYFTLCIGIDRTLALVAEVECTKDSTAIGMGDEEDIGLVDQLYRCVRILLPLVAGLHRYQRQSLVELLDSVIYPGWNYSFIVLLLIARVITIGSGGSGMLVPGDSL